ncbi:hypothetical protein [Candidatus Poriferisodalis sp.]|uniref:hypothetical protein n=1 Tax=Candidatus Poriferisodalis sp. TaxID=3101277 RepID=UPI003B013326
MPTDATEATDTAAAVPEAPVVTVTHGPTGVTNGRDEHGEGGSFRVTWNVTPADASCGFSLQDAEGESVIHEILTHEGAGQVARDLEVLYSAQAGRLPITLSIACRDDDSPQTVLELPVEIVEPEPEPEPAAVIKNYENRSADSKLPANDLYFFDHDEIRALFPECGPFPTSPEVQVWLDDFLGFWDRVYANWDAEVQIVDGARLASGWWSTEQIRLWLPESTITAESARANAVYDKTLNYVYLWTRDERTGSFAPNYSYYPHLRSDGQYAFGNLYRRLALAGYSSTDLSQATVSEGLRLVRDEGISAPGPNPASVEVGQMLAEWMLTRYRLPPTTREPTAWAMLSLLEVRDGNCVASSMRAICESGEPHTSAHLRHPSQGGSRLGTALWSIVCPEIDPERN